MPISSKTGEQPPDKLLNSAKRLSIGNFPIYTLPFLLDSSIISMPFSSLLLVFSIPLLSTANPPGSLHSSFTSSLSDLLNGFLSGLQASPLTPSPCIQAFTSIAPNWNEVTDTADYAWSSGKFANFFLILYKFDEFLGLFTAASERCSINIFERKLSALGTTEGVFKAMYQLGINIDVMAVTVT